MTQFPNLTLVKDPSLNETAIYGSSIEFKPLDNGIQTIYDILIDSINRFPNKLSFGQREVVKTHVEEREVETVLNGIKKSDIKRMELQELTPFNYISYREMGDLIHHIGSAFIHSGLKSKGRVGLYAHTSRYWKLIGYGAYTQSIEIATIYNTVGAAGLKHTIQEGNLTHLFVTSDTFPVIMSIIKEVPELNTIIYHGSSNDVSLIKLKEVRPDIQFIEFNEFIEMGKNNAKEPNPPKPEDTACIMYTSGSTGNPKGVVMTHQNIATMIASIRDTVGQYFRRENSIVIYLPFAHIFGFLIDLWCTFSGAKIGYGNPRTILDSMVVNCRGDIPEFKPDSLLAVPQVLDSVRKGAMNKLTQVGGIKQTIFNFCLNLKELLRTYGVRFTLLDFAFAKIRESLGGNIKHCIVGGAPLSNQSFAFTSNVICPIIQVYGMTEITGLGFSNVQSMNIEGQVGYPCPSIQYKLVDIPEMGYLSSNQLPQGEVCFRGGNVTSGYFNQPELTKETFDSEGWVHSGDVGQINPNGTLSIIDRKKNIVKLPNGEYIAFEKLESVYKTNLLVDMVCTTVNPEKFRPILVIYPNLEAVQRLANANNLLEHAQSIESVKGSKELTNLILADLIKTGKKEGLSSYEIIGGLVISEEVWTSENGMLTAAQKLKRGTVQERYTQDILDIFSKME